MKLGFVGAGNMAGAIIKGAVQSGVIAPTDLHIFDISESRMHELATSLGVIAYQQCDQMIRDSDMVVMAVKPYQIEAVFGQQRESLRGKAVISIAAGWTVERLEALLPDDVRVLRVMPNTPALVGAGMTVLSRQTSFTKAEQSAAESLFQALGIAKWVGESQIEAAIGVSGSGPAYAFLFIEAMADGGVGQGLTRQEATLMAAQTLLGAAKMALESGMHPGELKDMVCSPSGTTIAAVRELEKNAFRSAVTEAVHAASERAKEMRS